VGLDKLSLSFRVEKYDARPDQWDEVRRRHVLDDKGRSGYVTSMKKSERVGGSSVFVSLTEIPEARAGAWWGKVELNPSRVVDAEGVGLAHVEDLPEVLAVAEIAACIGMEPAEPVADWRVKRVDLARDFEAVDDPGRLIRGLAPVHRPYARLNLIHADPHRNRAETLMVGSGAGVVRLYNKHVQSGGQAAEGTVRWESECKKGWLNERGSVKRVSDLDAESTERLALDRWEWSQMGVEVASSIGRLVQATAQTELTERERVFFVGWLMCEAGGQPVRGLSKATLAKYRRVQRQIGIAAPCDVVSMVEVVSRLDWDSGREVLRVA
jgi:hypothetical protein